MSTYLVGADGYAITSFFDHQNSSGQFYDEPIPGLYYFPGPIMDNKFIESLTKIYNSPASEVEWESVGTGANSRQVVHYGYKYNYKTGNTKEKAPEMPLYIKRLRQSIRSLEVTGTSENESVLNQCIINKYEAGQGIGAHTDHKDYGNTICCYTIGSGATMTFKNKKRGDVVELYVEPNSWYVMTGEARWDWTHEMCARKSDMLSGVRIPRGQRISITFRSVKTDI